VNAATAEELEQLPRVGPSLARRIVAYREEHGAYRSIDDLRLVRGIGAATAALLAPLVTFSGGYRPIPE
jgi:competence protein ComEA